jgi:anti-anti-sigma factor
MGEGNIDILTRQQGQWMELELDAQSVDYHNAETLKQKIALQMQRQKQYNIRLNLEQVSFMDSAGLVMLLQAERTCKEQNCGFAISNAQPYVQKLLELAC